MKDFIYANKIFFCVLGAVTFVIFIYSASFSAPKNFPSGSIFKIEQGSGLRSVSLDLKDAHIIRSRILFEVFAILLGGEKRVKEADYYFENKLSVYEVARRIVKGEHHTAPIVVTIPEGFNAVQIADAFASKLSNFDRSLFLLKAVSLEGYLFPDTYFFLTTANEDDVLQSISENFKKKIKTVQVDILASGKTEKNIIIMASLVEGEGKGEEDGEFISGILWKRLSIGMPLQVDVAPETYKAKGLPKSPIGNPGLRAIKSAIYPKSSPYLYYLHDKDGNIHYAKSFAEHKQNVLKYLK